MDLSERQLTYFARIPINDSGNPQNGEGETGIALNDDDDPIAVAYNYGGHAPTATSVFAAGMGPVLESEDPLFEYKGKGGIIQQEWVEGRYQGYSYSENDDWTLDMSQTPVP